MKTENMAAWCGALASPLRLEIFRLLVRYGRRGLPAGEIATAVQAAPSTLSFHFRMMIQAGLLASRQEGRFVYYMVDFTVLREMVDYLTAECCTLEAEAQSCVWLPECFSDCNGCEV